MSKMFCSSKQLWLYIVVSKNVALVYKISALNLLILLDEIDLLQ